MNYFWFITSIILMENHIIVGQAPSRLSIPGAILISQPNPVLYRQQRILQTDPPRLRSRPISSPPIRPVVEEEEIKEPVTPTNNFDEEVNKLSIPLFQSTQKQTESEVDVPIPKPSPLPFRPERPIPLLRENIRDNGLPAVPRPALLLRQERPRQKEILDEPKFSRQRQQIIQQPAVVRQLRPQPTPRQPNQFSNEERHLGRTRKPPVQILRKYRTDNADGSITWGYENEDGTFKEETLGIDCVTKGKYGYIDPDGVRREYAYETGNKCVPGYEQIEEEEVVQPVNKLQKKQQLRPLPPQY